MIRHLAACLAIWMVVVSTASADTYPYDLETGREVGLLGAAGATFLLGALLDTSLPADAGTLRDRALVPAFDRGATRHWSPAADDASDWLVRAQMASPVGLMVSAPGSRQGGRLALIYAETMALNAGTTFALKRLFKRPRPFVHNDDPRVPDALRGTTTAYRSFPSGHSANAFASMVFFATTFERLNPGSGARGWVWGGCLTAAGTTGLLRYLAGRHYPTDIFAGAALGATLGWLVPHLHEVGDGPAGAAPGGLKVAWGFGF